MACPCLYLHQADGSNDVFFILLLLLSFFSCFVLIAIVTESRIPAAATAAQPILINVIMPYSITYANRDEIPKQTDSKNDSLQMTIGMTLAWLCITMPSHRKAGFIGRIHRQYTAYTYRARGDTHDHIRIYRMLANVSLISVHIWNPNDLATHLCSMHSQCSNGIW